ncbi:helix-turn-helix transcriptional regulator [Propionibacterium freudenreichii]|uniref:helix-turn-helix domain-containing protein n=1 Tax=Propionibacterium freudenreichii TaxID=1744 RepID=UPI00254D43CB|nr:helix-turn-helix transcriptional regulator [Propionibacterium freudenreichii]MDK9624688.1 helix-turn-helix transcriptional regulator [Propionibacterium freudenreichii]
MNPDRNDVAGNVARNLKAAREARGWSQDDLAQYLQSSGINIAQTGVSRWEQGEREPRATELRALARAFGTTVDALMQDPDDFTGTVKWNRVSSAFDAARDELLAAYSAYEKNRKLLLNYLASEPSTPASDTILRGYDKSANEDGRQVISDAYDKDHQPSDLWAAIGGDEPPF